MYADHRISYSVKAFWYGFVAACCAFVVYLLRFADIWGTGNTVGEFFFCACTIASIIGGMFGVRMSMFGLSRHQPLRGVCLMGFLLSLAALISMAFLWVWFLLLFLLIRPKLPFGSSAVKPKK